MIRLGYACINTRLPSSNRTCRLSSATPDRILELSAANLAALEEVLSWNVRHGILVFRISSDIIPFGSHPVNELPWWEILAPNFQRMGRIIREAGMRVSMHPGQYTVLNSLRPEVVSNSIAELVYHARFLDALGIDSSHKIVLHLGGTFGDKLASKARFRENFFRLPIVAQRRLVLENDEKSYTLADVLEVSASTGAPVVFDVFHHAWNPSFPDLTLRKQIGRAATTWKAPDGRQKIHYSNQWQGKPPGSHSQSVDLAAFAGFLSQVIDLELDIMLEVKDKEGSVLAIYEQFHELIPRLTTPPLPAGAE